MPGSQKGRDTKSVFAPYVGLIQTFRRSLPRNRHHRQGGEDPAAGVQLHRHPREHAVSGGRAPEPIPRSRPCPSPQNISSMNCAFCPQPLRWMSARSSALPPAHQPAPHHGPLRLQVPDRRRSADPSRLPARREQGVHQRLTGADPGHADSGNVEAQDAADATRRHHLHRTGDDLSPSMRRDRQLTQAGPSAFGPSDFGPLAPTGPRPPLPSTPDPEDRPTGYRSRWRDAPSMPPRSPAPGPK